MPETHGKRAVENDYVGILKIVGAYGTRVVAYSSKVEMLACFFLLLPHLHLFTTTPPSFRSDLPLKILP